MSDASLHPDSPLDGRYRLQERLGGGGMADVYLAEDLTLRRPVAVKILKAELATDPDLVERFRIEAQAAAQLSHPNIVAVFDRGSAGSSAYIVMEYVRGETLRQRIRRIGRFAPEDAVRTALAVLAALDAAHRLHIVHRDITSCNVLLDDAGRVKVADFGIARFGASALTRTGAMLGTSAYLSPEQARGRQVDERSDLYSLGVLLFEMLTGRLPFSGDSDVAIAVQHASAPPPDLRSLAPDLPEYLIAVVAKALSKEPADRYQSASEFAAALHRVPTPATVGAATHPSSPAPPHAATVVAADAATRADVGPTRQMQGEEQAAPTSARRGLRVRRWMVLVLATIGVGAAVWALATFVLVSGVNVPTLVGHPQADAVATLTQKGLKPAVHRVWADGVDTGDVARQRPVAGAEVDEGSKVDIWVSRGPLHVPSPDLTGLSASLAGSRLEEQALEGRGRKAASDVAAEGVVFRQRPAAGEPVARSDTVTFWVSTGPPLIDVPDVVGLSSVEAAAKLEAEGFVVSIDVVIGWGTPPGDVAGQDPGAGTRLRRGDEVVIEVAIL